MVSASSGAGPSTTRPGATVVIGSAATGDGGEPHSARHWLSCARRGGIDDAAQAHPRVACRAHRAVLTGGVHGRARPVVGSQVVDGPAGDRELGVAGVVAVLDAVAVLVERGAVCVDQDRAERFVAVVERLAREFHAAAEPFEVVVADRHRPEFTQQTALADATGLSGSTPARSAAR